MRFLDISQDVTQSNCVRLKHRAAPPGGVAVAVDQHDVDIKGPACNPVTEYFGAFVDDGGAHQPLDRRPRELAPSAMPLRTNFLDEFAHNRVHAFFTGGIVVPTCARLLSKSAKLAKFIGNR